MNNKISCDLHSENPDLEFQIKSFLFSQISLQSAVQPVKTQDKLCLTPYTTQDYPFGQNQQISKYEQN